MGVFFIGVISGPVAGTITYYLKTLFNLDTGQSLTGNFLMFFLLVGPIEELSKFFAAFITSYSKPDFSGSADGILLAIAASLGFAAGENVVYLNVYGPEATFLRMIFSNAAHVIFAVIWGYAFGVVIHESASLFFLIAALVIGSLLHGAYDFLLFLHAVTASIVLFAMIPGIYLVVKFLKNEHNRGFHRL